MLGSKGGGWKLEGAGRQERGAALGLCAPNTVGARDRPARPQGTLPRVVLY